MASIALHLKSHHKTVLRRTTFCASTQRLSTSPPPTSSDPADAESAQNSAASNTGSINKPSSSSYFSDVKSVLKQPPQHQFLPESEGSSIARGSIDPSPSNKSPYDKIMKNLSEYRQRSAGRLPSHSEPISFEKLYMDNVGNSTGNHLGGNDSKLGPGSIFDSIRKINLGLNNPQQGGGGGAKGLRHLESFKLKPTSGAGDAGRRPSSAVFGGTTDNLPSSVFGKELAERRERAHKGAMKTGLRMYDYDELGEKLRKLRPDTWKKQGAAGGHNHISLLSDLNDRLARLRIEEKESPKSDLLFAHLRESINSITSTNDSKKFPAMWTQLDGTPSFMLAPPKEHLVEKYFHPDNMSSAEKLKLELKRVRDEFKLHGSDCGSTQVQVAQLTTEIHHLSKLLHKKDKHSRKGLQAKVQQRKNLLKYLRRTDWDSYCFILSKLGLRDNPGYKL